MFCFTHPVIDSSGNWRPLGLVSGTLLFLLLLLAGLDAMRRFTGICPQRDVLYASLTAGEHLEFFARLKQVCAREWCGWWVV